MSDAFQERENTFEKQFVNEETLRFRAVARRNRALALWAAELQGMSGEAAETYAEGFVAANVGNSDDGVAAALHENLARAGAELSDHRIRRRMEEETAKALASVKAGR